MLALLVTVMAVSVMGACQVSYAGECQPTDSPACCNDSWECSRHANGCNITSPEDSVYRCVIPGGVWPIGGGGTTTTMETTTETTMEITTPTTTTEATTQPTTTTTEATTQPTTTEATTQPTTPTTEATTPITEATTPTTEATTPTTEATTPTTLPTTQTTTEATIPPTLPTTPTTTVATTEETTATTTLITTTPSSSLFGPACNGFDLCKLPGQCFDGTCSAQANRTCDPEPNDSCFETFCNPTTGECDRREKCRNPDDAQCYSPRVCSNGLCSPLRVLTNATCAKNPCYTNTQCSGDGSCFGGLAVPLADGSICAQTACFDVQCQTLDSIPIGAERVFCSRLVPKVVCESPADPCQQSTCDLSTGQCLISSTCPDLECQSATCATNGTCSYQKRTGETSIPGLTFSPSERNALCNGCAVNAFQDQCADEFNTCLTSGGICQQCYIAFVSNQVLPLTCALNLQWSSLSGCTAQACPVCSAI